jgi:hypothetical protein
MSFPERQERVDTVAERNERRVGAGKGFEREFDGGGGVKPVHKRSLPAVMKVSGGTEILLGLGEERLDVETVHEGEYLHAAPQLFKAAGGDGEEFRVVSPTYKCTNACLLGEKGIHPPLAHVSRNIFCGAEPCICYSLTFALIVSGCVFKREEKVIAYCLHAWFGNGGSFKLCVLRAHFIVKAIEDRVQQAFPHPELFAYGVGRVLTSRVECGKRLRVKRARRNLRMDAPYAEETGGEN